MSTLQAIMAAKAAEKQEQTTAVATGIASGADVVLKPDAPQPSAPTLPEAPAVDATKALRYAKCFTHRIMTGGAWFYPVDGFYYPETSRQKEACAHLAAQGKLIAENYETTE